MAKQMEKSNKDMMKWKGMGSDMDWMKWKAMHKVTMGLGLFIFGLVLWYTDNWAMAFMIVGILAILKGLWMWTK